MMHLKIGLLLVSSLGLLGSAAASNPPDPKTGACGNTDKEVADLCQVPGGVCHSFCVPVEGAPPCKENCPCEFRGSYIGDLVSFHDQAETASAANGDISATKVYRFATPAFAGFPKNDCDLKSAVGSMAKNFLGSTRKHVSFELKKTDGWKCASGNGTEQACATPLMPSSLTTESATNAGGKAILMGKGFGVDRHSVRDIIEYRTSVSQTEQTLMYQLFARDASVAKLNFGDAAKAPAVCIAPGCAPRNFTAGSFKFTVGTTFSSNGLEKFDAVRLEFLVSLENGAVADNDAVIVAKQDNSKIVFASNKTLFELDFDLNFLYGTYNREINVFETDLGVGNARISAVAPSTFELKVFVDLIVDSKVKTFCKNKICMLLYDPALSVADGAPKRPVGFKPSINNDPLL